MAYAPARFSCPHCRTPLRLRERPVASIRLACPDCRRPLELTDQSGELLVRPVEMEGTPARSRREAASFSPIGAGALKRTAKRFADPLVVTWVAAALVAVTLGIVVVRERGGAGFTAAEVTRADVAPDEAAATIAAGLQNATEDSSRVEATVATAAETAGLGTASTAATIEVERPPVVAVKPEAAPAVDPREAIAVRLAQRILRFEQQRPAPFELLRSQIEDMAGVAIRYDASLGSDPPERSVAVTLSLSEATLAQVLEAAALQAGLKCVVEADGVRLIRGTAPEQAGGVRSGASYAVR